MRISGFTIVRNAIQYNYPVVESIRSILPICDEFIINVGNSEDGTLGLIQSLDSPKVKIIENSWNMSLGKEVLSQQTNLALKECRGDWAFYLQSDEVIHEADLRFLKDVMRKYRHDDKVDALRFRWLHFYGSYYRYRIDSGWYQKQDRIIKNNGQVESYGDAYSFRRKDGRSLKSRMTRCLLYHYGWVQSAETMAQRRLNAERIGFVSPGKKEERRDYTFGDLNRFPVYFGTHPSVMRQSINQHEPSRKDWETIQRKYWWFPPKIFKIRYKTGRRVKEKIQ